MSHAGPVAHSTSPTLDPEAGTASDPDIIVEEVRSEPALVSLEREWNELLARSESNLLFLTHEWVTCWWRNFGYTPRPRRRADLFVLALRRRTRLCGLAPLVVQEERLFGLSIRVVRFLGHGVSDYSDFILEGDRDILLKRIVEHLLSRSKAWDVVDLREFYGASPNLPALQRCLANAPLGQRLYIDNICRFTPIEGEWEAFYQRGVNRRQRRAWRNLQAAGQLTLRFVRSLLEEPGLVQTMAEIERQHPDAGPDRAGILNVEGYREFFADFLRRSSMRGWLTIALLACGGRVIAYYLNFRYNGRYYLYSTAYRGEFRRFGVGKLLLVRMLQHFWESGDGEIDFLRGDEAFKQDWSTDARQNMRLVASQRSVRSRLWMWMWFTLLPALHRRTPAIHGAVSIVVESDCTTALKRGVGRLKRAALRLAKRR